MAFEGAASRGDDDVVLGRREGRGHVLGAQHDDPRVEQLDEDALVQILLEPKNALTKQYKKLFHIENVGLTFEPDALRAVAKRAIKRGTGARGLRAILEEMMTDIMFELPTREDVREVVITKESVLNDKPPLIVTEQVRAKKEA